MDNLPLFTADIVNKIPDTNSAYQLTHFELFNWGPFSRFHRAEIDPVGTAIIGQTGSGKTTLVDAFMTLIAQNPKYNLASTGGHESDRDLISYVRGVTGAGNEGDNNDHILRPNKTITGISAYFSNGSKYVQISAILWIDGSSQANADLKRVWIFSQNTQYALTELLDLFQDGGMRALTQLSKNEDQINIHHSKKAYLAQVRRYFEVNDNAFTLLNRAAGLKQLNSIDDLFRELVLDDHSCFKRASEVAAEFDDLAAIHTELETAHKQQQSLLPIEIEYRHYQKNSELLESEQTLNSILPKWFAAHAVDLWKTQQQNAESQIIQFQKISETLTENVLQATKHSEQLHENYLKLGGNSVEHLKEKITQQTKIVTDCERNAADYSQLTARLKLDESISAMSLAKNQQLAEQLIQEQEKQYQQKQQLAWEKGAIKQSQSDSINELQKEIHNIKASPDSNIPGKFQLFRSELANALNIKQQELPFIAELVAVKTEHKQWRGAIERAIGSHRLRLLVPSQQLKTALDWINSRDNRLHVRLLDAKAPGSLAAFLKDGFTHKLTFKTHPYRETLKFLLASIDRHCVDNPNLLRSTTYAMTQQGLMSGKQGLFEKQDQTRINSNWMTGFDNKDRLSNLEHELKNAQLELRKSETAFEQEKNNCSQIQQTITLLKQLSKLEFIDIDLPSATIQLQNFNDTLKSMLDPDSDTSKAQQRWAKSKQELDVCLKNAKDNEIELDRKRHECDEAIQQKEKAFLRLANGLNENEKTLADSKFTVPNKADLYNLNELEREATEKLLNSINKLKDKRSNSEAKLGKLMVKAKALDTGALAEADSEMSDIPVYLTQFKVLNEEALPEKQSRFLNYLNQSSDQGVTQLLSNISNEVNIIEERIQELNQTMRRVDFRPGSYLRLEPRRIVHDSLKTLQKAQRYLRAAALKEDNGESHYRALFDVVELLREAVDRKKTLGAKALLDPRYRLQFFISVINKDNGEVIETRTGSQGGSGGEKEIMASYILTASLSYALCPDGLSKPLFSTIILDEAFSRSSRAVATRIIAALREFGLHPLFITPNKEIRLLRDHTRSAVLIDRRNQFSRMTSLSWEALETKAKTQLETMMHEVTD